jgi:hypothetical protein
MDSVSSDSLPGTNLKVGKMMSSSQFLSIAGILGLVFGLLLVVVPAQFLAMYGSMGGEVVIGMARGWGASLLGLGVIAWSARNSSGPVVQAILLGTFVSALIGGLNSLYGVLMGGMGEMGWLNVVIQAFLVVGAGMLRFGGSGNSGGAAPAE